MVSRATISRVGFHEPNVCLAYEILSDSQVSWCIERFMFTSLICLQKRQIYDRHGEVMRTLHIVSFYSVLILFYRKD